jgi:hypothetical protein
MGTFAKTANIVFRLSFADQGKQTSIFRFFRLQQTKRKFAFFVFHLQQTNGRCRFSVSSVFGNLSLARCVLSITLYFNLAFCFLVVRFCCEPLREAGRGHVWLHLHVCRGSFCQVRILFSANIYTIILFKSILHPLDAISTLWSGERELCY